jgi:hypothetical protein
MPKNISYCIVLFVLTLFSTLVGCNQADRFNYVVRVKDIKGNAIPNTSVDIDIPGGSLRSLTDTNGTAQFQIPKQYANIATQISVNAPGYESKSIITDLLPNSLPFEIRLDILTPTPTITPSTIYIPTSTYTPLPTSLPPSETPNATLTYTPIPTFISPSETPEPTFTLTAIPFPTNTPGLVEATPFKTRLASTPTITPYPEP